MTDSQNAKPGTNLGDASEDLDLETLRRELDQIDQQLLECLRERIECCKSIARYKRRFNVPMMQPHRIDVVQQRAARFGRQHGIGLEFLHRLYTVVIDETCRVEDLLIGEHVLHPAVNTTSDTRN